MPADSDAMTMTMIFDQPLLSRLPVCESDDILSRGMIWGSKSCHYAPC